MDLSTQAFLYDVSSRQDEWVNAISNSLPPFAQYSLVSSFIIFTFIEFHGTNELM